MTSTQDAPALDHHLWDVVIIGAGINGAATAGALARAGHRVLVVDRGDIGSGTSQASTMLVWGGLLYLKDWELRTVWALCRERDQLIASADEQVRACQVRYLATPGVRPASLVHAALYTYWALGLGRRRLARRLRNFAEEPLLKHRDMTAYGFEEGALIASDARFVLDVMHDAERHGARWQTYHRVDSCRFDRSRQRWRLSMTDPLSGAASHVDARFVINAAGPWADRVNEAASIETPYRHVHSRGVSLTLKRDVLHDAHLVFDTADGSALTLAPWGPVAVWASTESLHDQVDVANTVAPEDIACLLDQYNARFRSAIGVEDVVALRVGVRPVPVRRAQHVPARGEGLSRHHRLHLDTACPWLTIFGGKLSGCHALARDVEQLVTARISRTRAHRDAGSHALPPDKFEHAPVTMTFPGMPGVVVAPGWSAAHEHCRTLADYLRRRTNIAQWIPRGGFGRRDEHAALLRTFALAIHNGDDAAASRDVASYRASVEAADMILAAARIDRGAHSLGVSA